MVGRREQLLKLLDVHRDAMTRLTEADEIAQELRVILRELALEAHEAGYTWQDIGDALGGEPSCGAREIQPEQQSDLTS